VTVAVEQFGYERAVAFLGSIPGAAERATARALNRAAAAGREAAIVSIDQRYAVKPSDVRDKIRLTAATPAELSVQVVAKSNALSLGYFPHTPGSPGTGGRGRALLQAEVIRGQERAVGGAFIASINGRPRVMIRTGNATKTGRTQIRSVYGPPIAVMMGAESVRQAIEDKAHAVLDEQLGVEIDRELGKAE
jgi:hypothetical protein